MGNNGAYDKAQWISDIHLAQQARIDGFVLNMGTPWTGTIESQVSLAFQASNEVANEFKLFFAFDYEGGSQGAWPVSDVEKALDVRCSYCSRERSLTWYRHTLRTTLTPSTLTRLSRIRAKRLFRHSRDPAMLATGLLSKQDMLREGSTSFLNTRARVPIGRGAIWT